MKPLSDQQRLFLVESDQIYRAWREVLWRHRDYKYGMRWKNVNGKDYLLRLTSASGNSKSLGPLLKLSKFSDSLKKAKRWRKKNIRALKSSLTLKES